MSVESVQDGSSSRAQQASAEGRRVEQQRQEQRSEESRAVEREASAEPQRTRGSTGPTEVDVSA